MIPINTIEFAGHSPLEIKQGEEKQLSINMIPENHTDSVILSSSSECVVVDEKGKVTAASAGTSVVRASSAHGNVWDECITKVRDTSAVRRRVSPNPDYVHGWVWASIDL